MNDLVKQEAQMPAVANVLEDMGLSAKDINIPFLSLAQNTGKAVDEGWAKQGDIYCGQDNTVLGGYDKPVEIIPIKAMKLWREFEKIDGGQKFVTQYPVTAANENQPWEYIDAEGRQMRRYYTYNVFVLLVSECEKGEQRPYIVSFYSKSQYAGKKITSYFFNRAQINKSHMGHTFFLSSKKEKKNTATYAVYDVTKGTENKYFDESLACYNSLPSNAVAAEKFRDTSTDVVKEAEVVKDNQEF